MVYKIYVAEGVNYVDYSGPTKEESCLSFSFLNVSFIYHILF